MNWHSICSRARHYKRHDKSLKHQSNSSELHLNYKRCELDGSMFISDFKYLLKIYYRLSEWAKASVYRVRPKMLSSSKVLLGHPASASLFHQSHLLPRLPSMAASLPPVMPADKSPQGRQFLKTGIVFKQGQVILNNPRTASHWWVSTGINVNGLGTVKRSEFVHTYWPISLYQVAE